MSVTKVKYFWELKVRVNKEVKIHSFLKFGPFSAFSVQNWPKFGPQICKAAQLFIRPFLTYAVEQSASWQHCAFYAFRRTFELKMRTNELKWRHEKSSWTHWTRPFTVDAIGKVHEQESEGWRKAGNEARKSRTKRKYGLRKGNPQK